MTENDKNTEISAQINDDNEYDSCSSSTSTVKKGNVKKKRSKSRAASLESEIINLEHKFIQCSISKTDRKTEATLPEELSTFLQCLVKIEPKKEGKESNEIRNLILKITKTLTEMSSRPISKVHEYRTDYTKQCQDTSNKLNKLIKEHVDGAKKSYQKLSRDIRRAEEGILSQDERIASLKEMIEENRLSKKVKSSDPIVRLRSSLAEQHFLKTEIKFNQGQFKKYKKMLTEKEFAKQKLISQLERARKNVAKLKKEKLKTAEDQSPRSGAEEDVFFGGISTYVKNKSVKIVENATVRSNTTKKPIKSFKK